LENARTRDEHVIHVGVDGDLPPELVDPSVALSQWAYVDTDRGL
jgi:hypothetical protein